MRSTRTKGGGMAKNQATGKSHRGQLHNDSTTQAIRTERFVGVREEVRRLHSGVREEIEPEDTARYRRAAELFAETLDCDAVDSILELTPGTTRTWATEEAFMRRAVQVKVTAERFGTVAEELGRALDPRQREAARLLAVERRSQTDTAAQVGVDRRTIFNWLQRPVFTRYQQQLESEESARLTTEWRARRAEVEHGLQEIREISVKKYRDLAEGGDPKVIGLVLSKLLS
jgi:DNA-directed RNA polymerase specialized sigma24 family protein